MCLCDNFTQEDDTCGTCDGTCTSCVGPSPAECMSNQEQVDFVRQVSNALHLPRLTETTDHLLCFNQPRLTWDTSGCAEDPLLAAVTGTISGYTSGTGATPTQSQCYELLSTQWYWLIGWFDTLFPNFTGPADATDSQILTIKSVIYLWILNFGPAEMKSSEWTELTTVLTDATRDWTKLLGWAGESPMYATVETSTDAKSYPSILEAWLKSDSGCGGKTAGCVDLAVFNLKSSLCYSPCTVQSFCTKADSTSYCAINGAN